MKLRGKTMDYNIIKVMQDRNQSLEGYVRILHAVPDAPNVDVYANDILIARNLDFGNYTDYTDLEEGNYVISLYVTGSVDSPVISNMLYVSSDAAFTVAAVGRLQDISFLAIVDDSEPIDPNFANIRFAHLSPNAPEVDITLEDGTYLFSDVSFQQITPYNAVSPIDYTLEVRVAGTSTVVLTVPNVRLERNQFYTIYAIGLVGEEPELNAILVEDRMI